MSDNTDSFLVPQGTLATEALKDIEKEIVNEQVEMVRDYMKGILRFRNDLEKKIEEVNKEAAKRLESLNGQIANIDKVRSKVKEGNAMAMKKVKVPVHYLSEKTVRLAGMEWLKGGGSNKEEKEE